MGNLKRGQPYPYVDSGENPDMANGLSFETEVASFLINAICPTLCACFNYRTRYTQGPLSSDVSQGKHCVSLVTKSCPDSVDALP